MPGDLYTASDDWELASLGGLAGAAGPAGGFFLFVLRSKKLDVTEPLSFSGVGMGLGGSQCGFSDDDFEGLVFSQTDVGAPFSISQIHQCAGRLTSASIGPAGKLPINFGWTWVSAFPFQISTSYYFKVSPDPSDPSTTVGSGGGAYVVLGAWCSFTLNNNSLNPAQSIVDFLKGIPADIKAFARQASDLNDMIVKGASGRPWGSF